MGFSMKTINRMVYNEFLRLAKEDKKRINARNRVTELLTDKLKQKENSSILSSKKEEELFLLTKLLFSNYNSRAMSSYRIEVLLRFKMDNGFDSIRYDFKILNGENIKKALSHLSAKVIEYGNVSKNWKIADIIISSDYAK